MGEGRNSIFLASLGWNVTQELQTWQVGKGGRRRRSVKMLAGNVADSERRVILR